MSDLDQSPDAGTAPGSGQPLEHVNVLIVGAGLSGIGAACHLRETLPGRSIAILEARAAIGGTWDLFRYPGIRSDSDMFTLGYNFRPWDGAKSIADGPSILEYVRTTAASHGVDKLVRYHQRVTTASWSSQDSRWTVAVADSATGITTGMTCDFLYCNTGYYRYDEGYSPAFPGADRFEGQIIHPQHWPEDLDYAGKRIVVIGSGATAVTLVPSLAATAGHVTMLQRSPTYIMSLPGTDRIADAVRARLPERWAYSIVRWKNVLGATALYQLSRRRPRFVKGLIRKGVTAQLPAGYDVATHFSPRYQPWDQRLCLVPDGDLFKSLRRGDASIATGAIETFTKTGVQLTSGEHLGADIIVTATGLNLLLLGGLQIQVDGRPIDLSTTVGYKGMMFSGIPNMVATVGYTNASWTLKADLIAAYVCRLLKHMDQNGYRQATPIAPPPDQPTVPFMDLNSGYVMRSIDLLPQQGAQVPWRLHQNYLRDIWMLKHGKVDDPAMVFTSRSPKKAPALTR